MDSKTWLKRRAEAKKAFGVPPSVKPGRYLAHRNIWNSPDPPDGPDEYTPSDEDREVAVLAAEG